MSATPETFVDTPRGRLHVWTMDGVAVEANTLDPDDKATADYRHNPDAQACAEYLLINRLRYTLGLFVLPDDHPSLGRWGVAANHQRWALPAGTIMLRRPDCPWLPPTQGAYNLVRRQVFPALAEWLNTPHGIALRLRGELLAVRTRLDDADRLNLNRQEHDRLTRHYRELATRLDEVTGSTGTDGGGGA
jgi:hypothetical protein